MHILGTWIGADAAPAKRSRSGGPRTWVFAAGLALGFALGASVGAAPPPSRLRAPSGGLRRAGMLATRLLRGVRRPHDGNSVALCESATGSETAQAVHQCSGSRSQVGSSPPASAVKPTGEVPDRTLARV
jgi:hypothetical protein